MKKLIIAIALLSITTAFSQNIELIATLDEYYTGFREVAGNDQNAFIALQGTSGMLVLDITDVTNPYPVGLLENAGTMQGGIALSGDFVYLGCYSSMKVVDVSDPANPQILGSCQTQTSIDETFYYDGFCYITSDYMVEIVDVHNPSAPQIISEIEPPGDLTRSSVVYDDLLYITSFTGMTIYDVSDPPNPVQLGFFPAPDVNHLDVSGDYAIIETWVEDSLIVIDVSNPTAPQETGSFYLGDDEDLEHMRAIGNILYASKDISSWNRYEYGVIVIDLSDPANPEYAGCFGESSTYLFHYNNYLYTHSGYKGFRIYEISDPVEPEEISNYYRINPQETLITGNFAFVKNDGIGIQVFDISDIYNPVEVEFYYSPDRAKDIKMRGEYIYLADRYSGLRIIDISDPYNLVEVGFFDTPDYSCYEVELKDSLAFTATDNSITILNVENPDSIFEVSALYNHGGNISICTALFDNYTVWSIGDSIHILDTAEPSNPGLIGSCQISVFPQCIEIDENYAYIPSFSPGGVSVVNLEDPTHPYEEALLFENVQLEDAEVDGDYCYLALYDGAFEIWDISNLSNPQMIGSYNTLGAGQEITLCDTLVFFGASPYFYIFDVSDYVSVGKAPESTSPMKFELSPAYPNPFNQQTVLSFKLQAASYVSLDVFDVTGRNIGAKSFVPLRNRWMSAGSHSVPFDGEGLTSGVYFVRLEAGDIIATRKMLLLK